MIYTDEENKRWWAGLTKYGQEELFNIMRENAKTPGYADFTLSIYEQWKNGVTLSGKQIAAIRKWAS